MCRLNGEGNLSTSDIFDMSDLSTLGQPLVWIDYLSFFIIGVTTILGFCSNFLIMLVWRYSEASSPTLLQMNMAAADMVRRLNLRDNSKSQPRRWGGGIAQW